MEKRLKKASAWVLTACLILMLFPVAHAEAVQVNAATWEDVNSAITNATTDTVINLTADVTTPSEKYTLTCAYHITITSDGTKSLTLGGGFNSFIIENAHLTLKNITIIGATTPDVSTPGCLSVKNGGILDIDGSTFVPRDDTDRFIYLNGDTAVLNIYSAEFKKGCARYAMYLNKGKENLLPTGDITIADFAQTQWNGGLSITPQTGYKITSALFDGEDITSKIGTGYMNTVPQGTIKPKNYSTGLSIKVSKSDAAIYPVTVDSPLTNGSVTSSVSSAAAGDPVKLTVAPSEGCRLKADSLTVTKAGGGTVSAEKQPDGTYLFTMPDEAVTVTAVFEANLIAAAPTFSAAAGKVAPNTQVSIATATEGASIYYTTDGTDPSTTNGRLYSGPVSIAADTTLKAVAVLDGYTSSTVTTAAYTVDTTLHSIVVRTFGDNYHYNYSIWVNGKVLVEKRSGSFEYEYRTAAKPGDTVEFAVTPEDGYKLTELSIDHLTPKPSYHSDTGRYSFTMPAAVDNVIILPKVSAVRTVTVADGITGGTVTTDAADGTTAGPLAVTATPSEGYHLKSIAYSYDGKTWTSLRVGSNGKALSFTPTGNVTVKAAFAKGTDISLANADELKTFAAAVNAGDAYIGAAVTLTGDIALTGEWTPIGTEKTPFEGTFDGGGHTISGLQITKKNDYTGLFGIAETVKNLTVTGTISIAGGDDLPYVGGVAGRVSGELSNCTSAVDIRAGRGWIGGVAGGAIRVSGCKNYGMLTVAVSKQEAGAVGGILGYLERSERTVDQCANYGSITFDGGMWSMTDSKSGVMTIGNAASGSFGGIVGEVADRTTIKNSCNKGSVIGDMRFAGGVVGQGFAAVTIQNCYSTGEITETGNAINKNRVRLGGLLGSANYCRGAVTIENSYCTGSVTAQKSSSYINVAELECNSCDYNQAGGGTAAPTVTNSYGHGQMADITASKIGDAYKADNAVVPVNGGYPLLQWESDTVSDTKYAVTISAAPASAAVTVYSDAAMKTPVGIGSSYELKAGTYYYRAVAAGYGTETGSFAVSIRPVAVTVTLRPAAAVTFVVSPANADFAVTDSSGKAVTADSGSGGKRTYTLYTGNTYCYSASADGYNSTTREYTASGSATVNVSLTASSQIPGAKTISPSDTPYTISAGGTYSLKAGDYNSGYININTTEPVILAGSGVGTSSMCEDLHIVCQKSGVQLTLSDVYISNTDQVTNLINYQGSGNTLNFEGVSILNQDTGASGYAMVHVNTSASLTVTGGTAYFYKRDQGAGIGGNGGAKGSEGQAPEYNGNISIEGASLFMKNSKQGALIGSGANASSTNYTPGGISINGSTLNLIAVSRGAAIGGAAGSSGGAQGASLTISDSSININVDWSGAAIGGGGYDSGNDAKGGTLNYESGSIRTYVDTNAVGQWGVSTAGVNGNRAVTAAVMTGGDPAYLLTLNTAMLAKKANNFTVKEGSRTIYSGGLHQYRYINEDAEKTQQATINYTIDNWVPLDDSNLYLYLAGADHTLTVNGETVTAAWNSATKTFALKYGLGGTSGTTETGKTTTTTVEVTPATNGTTSTATVTPAAMADTLTKALAVAKEAGTAADLEIKVNAPATATEVKTSIPAASISDAANAEIAELSVNTPVGTVQLNTAALNSVARQTGSQGSVTVTVKQVDPATLTPNQQKLISGGTVVEVSIAAGNQNITRFGGGTATITVPAGKVKSGQTARVYYLNSRGRLILLPDSYNAADNTVTYSTPHLSEYVVLAQNKWTSPFRDVANTAWCADAVKFASVSGLFQGTTATAFSPNASMTRAMLVSVLWRMEGKPTETKSADFGDVAADAWYADAVNWAAANGIVGGYTAETFSPSRQVTRQQLAAILARFAKYCGYDVSGAADLSRFTDQAKISDFAKADMAWAVNAGLISGTTSTTLDPTAVTTRAQVAAILMRFQQKTAI